MTFLAGGGDDKIEEAAEGDNNTGDKSNSQESMCRLKPKHGNLEENCFDKLTNYLGMYRKIQK